MPHPDQVHSVGELLTEEIVPHAKPVAGGRDQPTRYVQVTATVQTWRLDLEQVHGPMFELRIVHPQEDEATEVWRFADEKSLKDHQDAIIGSLTRSIEAAQQRDSTELAREADQLVSLVERLSKAGVDLGELFNRPRIAQKTTDTAKLEDVVKARGLDPKSMRVEDHTKG